MKHKNKVKSLRVALLLSFSFSLSTVMAQEAIPATGGNATGNGGSISYSVGQAVCNISSGNNGLILQGVQQPIEISVITAIEEAKSINLSVSAYPNPVAEYLILEIKDIHLLPCYYYLYNSSGILLQSEKIEETCKNIVLNHLLPATYFVKLIQNNKEIKTFKIIKK